MEAILFGILVTLIVAASVFSWYTLADRGRCKNCKLVKPVLSVPQLQAIVATNICGVCRSSTRPPAAQADFCNDHLCACYRLYHSVAVDIFEAEIRQQQRGA